MAHVACEKLHTTCGPAQLVVTGDCPQPGSGGWAQQPLPCQRQAAFHNARSIIVSTGAPTHTSILSLPSRPLQARVLQAPCRAPRGGWPRAAPKWKRATSQHRTERKHGLELTTAHCGADSPACQTGSTAAAGWQTASQITRLCTANTAAASTAGSADDATSQNAAALDGSERARRARPARRRRRPALGARSHRTAPSRLGSPRA